jgi:hypothetical protein
MVPSAVILIASYQGILSNPTALQEYMAGGSLTMVSTPLLDFLSDISFALSLLLRGFLMVKGNDLYRHHIHRRVEHIRLEGGDALRYRYTLAKKGGTNFIGVVVYLITYAIAMVLSAVLLAFIIVS